MYRNLAAALDNPLRFVLTVAFVVLAVLAIAGAAIAADAGILGDGAQTLNLADGEASGQKYQGAT